MSYGKTKPLKTKPLKARIQNLRSQPLRWLGLGTFIAILSMGCQLNSPPPPPELTSSANQPVSNQPASVQSLPIGALLKIDVAPTVTPTVTPTDERAIKTETIELEVAKTPKQQAIGLMNRQSLDQNKGMLFPFNPPQPVSFWMKNTLISLDMIFVRNNRIVKIHRDVPPCKTPVCPAYPSGRTIDSVIELRAGRAKELALEVGDSLKVELLEAP